MSTLTLSVEEFFRPDLSSSVSKMAAGSVTNSQNLAKHSRLAPEFRQHVPKFSLGGYLRSTPELGLHSLEMHPEDQSTKLQRAKDDLATGISTFNHSAHMNSLPVLQSSSFSPFVEIPHVILAVSKLPQGSIGNERTENKRVSTISGSESQNAPTKQRSLSEEVSMPPLRKLKLSLKLPKLTKLHSMSQLSPKSVRFASRLEKVKMFDGKASPSTVSLQCTPLGSPKYDFPVDDYFSLRKHYDDVSDDEKYSSSDSDTFTEFTKDKQYKISLNNFVSPQNIYDKRDLPVYLQSVNLTADKKLLVLLVMCQNLAFEKNLSVKLTFNEWQSLMIFNSAVYTKLFSSVNFDQFKFTIPLTHLPSSLTAQFCFKYNVNSMTFWDNNDSKNYKFSLEKYLKPSMSKDLFNFKPVNKADSFTYKPPMFSPKRSANSELEMLDSPDVDASLDRIPKSGSNAHHYRELVSKLMSVRDTEEKPKFTRSLTLSPRPRYSQSYILKKGTDSTGQTSPLGPKTANGMSSNDIALPKISSDTDVSKSHTEKSFKASTEASTGGQVRPPMVHSYASAPGTLTHTNVGSMSYADLLLNYCFNGTDKGASTTRGNPSGSFNSSCNSSSSSVSSEYLTPASTFQSMTDSFYV